MPNIIGATNYFAKSYENTVPMTLGGSVVAGAATVPVNNMTNYTDGDVICFVVDGATPALKQVFTGTKNGSNIINVVWTEFPTGGVNVPHSAGATVIDYVSATHWALLQKGITSSINQDGSLKTAAVQAALNITGGAVGGWTPTGFTPSSVVANGNRSYNLTFSANNLTNVLSPGMRLMTQRTVTAPTQCTSLNGTTQYYSKTAPAGMTFTDNFTASAWIKLSNYTASADMGIISRFNGTSGWILHLTSTGQVKIFGQSSAGVNRAALSYQSVPLNKWVHVAATLTLSTGTANIYIDGVLVPSAVSGTATAVVQAGNLEVGSYNASNFFPGKIAQAAIFSAVLSQATIQSYISQGLAGTETSLVSAYSFNNSINDLNTTNANNLTANGSAVATNPDSPFGGQANGTISSTLDYAIVTAATFSTNTTLSVQVPEGCTIPTSGGVSAVSYATVKAPYGMPVQRGKWRVDYILKSQLNGGGTANTWYSGLSAGAGTTGVILPTGEWNGYYDIEQYSDVGAGGSREHYSTFSTNATSESDSTWTVRQLISSLAANALFASQQTRQYPISNSTATTWYVLFKETGTIANNVLNNGSIGTSIWGGELAYL